MLEVMQGHYCIMVIETVEITHSWQPCFSHVTMSALRLSAQTSSILIEHNYIFSLPSTILSLEWPNGPSLRLQDRCGMKTI